MFSMKENCSRRPPRRFFARSLAALVAIGALGGCETDWAQVFATLDRLDRACVQGYRMQASVIGPPQVYFYPRFRSGDGRPIPRGMHYRMSVGSLQAGQETPFVAFRDVVEARDEAGQLIPGVYETRVAVVTVRGDARQNFIVRIEKRPPLPGLGADRPDCYARSWPGTIRLGQ